VATEDPNPLRFLISGKVSAWNPVTRLLHIGECEFWVSPEVLPANVAVGARFAASGYEEPSGRRVVTRFTLD
jgi:hypothetical protein